MAGPKAPQGLALLLWSLAQGRSIVDVEGEAGLAAVDLEEEPAREGETPFQVGKGHLKLTQHTLSFSSRVQLFQVS